MKKLIITGALAAVAALSQASFTMATFADPATDGTTPMFTWDKTANTLSGSWTMPGLVMDTPGFTGGGQQNDVMVMFDPVTMTSVVPNQVYTLGSGKVTFYTTDVNDPFFTITFDSGTFVYPTAVGASSFSSDNVVFSGDNVPSGLMDNQFAFSFANASGGNDMETFTASFTSSADVVPEPVSIFALGVGIAAMARRRTKRSS